MSIPAISNTSYSISSGATTLYFNAATWSSLACNYVVKYNATYVLNTITINEPTWLTFTEASRSFLVETSSVSDAGVYTITVTASIPQPSDGSGVKTVSESFTLAVINECSLTLFEARVIPDVTTRVN
jgi:hypothetical protein